MYLEPARTSWLPHIQAYYYARRAKKRPLTKEQMDIEDDRDRAIISAAQGGVTLTTVNHTLAADSSTVTLSSLIGKTPLQFTIFYQDGGSEVKYYDWDDPDVFNPSTGQHVLGGTYPENTTLSYLVKPAN